MLLQGVNQIEEIQVDKDIPYFPLPEEEIWKVEQLQGMMEERQTGELEEDEMELFNYLCTN